MRNKHTLSVLLLATVALGACADITPTEIVDAPVGGAAAQLDAVAEGRFLVYLRKGPVDVPAFGRRAAAAHGGVLHHAFDESGFRAVAITLPAGAAHALSRDPHVARIAPDPVYPRALQGTVTQFGAVWGLDRIDQRFLPLNGTYVYAYTGANVWAYLIDSGIRPTHNEFGARASVGYDARPFDVRGGLPQGHDCHGHGTHVAGSVGGSTYGVAKAVNLVGVRVSVECTDSIVASDVIAGIYWVRDQKVANPGRRMVANLSLAVPANADVDNAVNTLINAGVPAIVAAGNLNQNACNFSPARVSNAVTVGGTTSSDARYAGSNWGSCLNLFAPGENVLSAWRDHDSHTQTRTGTSMATAYTSGVAALYLEENPSASPTAVRNTLISRATSGVLSNIGSGSPNRLLYSRPVIWVDIDGPSYIYVEDDENWDYHQWTAIVSGGRAPYHYHWEVRYPDVPTGWGTVGTNSDTVSFGVTAGNGKIELRVTVTSDDGAVRTTQKNITVTGPGSGCDPNVIIC